MSGQRVRLQRISDDRGVRELLSLLAPLMPRLEMIWADDAYAGEKLQARCKKNTGWRLKLVPRDTGIATFEILPRRWVVERSIAWLFRNRGYTGRDGGGAHR